MLHTKNRFFSIVLATSLLMPCISHANVATPLLTGATSGYIYGRLWEQGSLFALLASLLVVGGVKDRIFALVGNSVREQQAMDSMDTLVTFGVWLATAYFKEDIQQLFISQDGSQRVVKVKGKGTLYISLDEENQVRVSDANGNTVKL